MNKIESSFKAEIKMIGINPFIFVPDNVLTELFKQSGRNKSPIPITGTVNGLAYQQTLVKFQGSWRLYINTIMLKDSPKRIGETIVVTVAYDPVTRTIEANPQLIEALSKNKVAYDRFNSLAPSLRNEIFKYLNQLKTEETLNKNVEKAIDFLLGKGRFVGRTLLNKTSE